ncbi:hypothetical protein L596_014294 [Steinernema carpocapsae]|uniref:Uncharacterized protein n=1 Tax=Steinernema carpocapsae TaxID=34508 RepID=A0A4U5NBQ1_STECR|nr:hypothetical protein L596_014294 [Steinernema carpocapsae]
MDLDVKSKRDYKRFERYASAGVPDAFLKRMAEDSFLCTCNETQPPSGGALGKKWNAVLNEVSKIKDEIDQDFYAEKHIWTFWRRVKRKHQTGTEKEFYHAELAKILRKPKPRRELETETKKGKSRENGVDMQTRPQSPESTFTEKTNEQIEPKSSITSAQSPLAVSTQPQPETQKPCTPASLPICPASYQREISSSDASAITPLKYRVSVIDNLLSTKAKKTHVPRSPIPNALPIIPHDFDSDDVPTDPRLAVEDTICNAKAPKKLGAKTRIKSPDLTSSMKNEPPRLHQIRNNIYTGSSPDIPHVFDYSVPPPTFPVRHLLSILPKRFSSNNREPDENPTSPKKPKIETHFRNAPSLSYAFYSPKEKVQEGLDLIQRRPIVEAASAPYASVTSTSKYQPTVDQIENPVSIQSPSEFDLSTREFPDFHQTPPPSSIPVISRRSNDSQSAARDHFNERVREMAAFITPKTSIDAIRKKAKRYAETLEELNWMRRMRKKNLEDAEREYRRGIEPERHVRCVFCQEHSYTNACYRYPTLEDRKERCRQLRRCDKCGLPMHEGECQFIGHCRGCQKKTTHWPPLCDRIEELELELERVK